jgi:flagellar secretion chaperone FliS
MMEGATKALNAYKNVDLDAAVLGGSPHELIAKLLTGAIESIGMAKKYVQNKDIAAKSRCITSAITIITDGLKSCLNMKEGGEIARNLDALYDYMARRLIEAHARNDVTRLDEVTSLLREIKSGWDGIKDKT